MISVRSSLALASMLVVSTASAAQFASSVVGYTAGTETVRTNAAAGLGKPEGTVDAFTIYSIFSPHYQVSQITGIGVGGSYQVAFPSPISVISGRELGVFTNQGVNDVDYPNGYTGTIAESFSTAFYGLRRTAAVEVTSSNGTVASLGRIIFDNPTNAFATGIDPYAVNGTGLTEADYGKPFLGTVASFNNSFYADSHAILAGSAGGDWLDVSGLGDIASVRFFAPQWLLADGSLSDTFTSGTTTTNAALYIVGVSANNAAVPEPMLLGCVGAGMLLLARRRA